MWPRRSARKTKKSGERGRREEDESDGETSPPPAISRTGSVAKLHKVARKIKSAMGSHDTGQLPAVRRARPNMEEYEAMSSKPPSRASSISRSLSARSGSDESLSSPEQRTVTRRIVPVESSRPTVQTLFESGQTIGSGPVLAPTGEMSEQESLGQPSVRGEPTLLVAILPDGSTMTSEGRGGR